jgi:hypothetical protein
MSEIFTITVKNTAVTTVIDVLAAYGSSTQSLRILAVEFAANGQATVGNYPISLKYLPPTVTLGSGGATATPHNINPAGASPTFNGRAVDTTQATTSSTAVSIAASQFNPINGYYWQPPTPIGDEPKTALSGAFVLSLDGAPGASINVSATMWLREG